MLPAILGRKIGMTQVYDADGTLHPVTVVQAGPCSVTQIKTSETDGYNAVQIAFEDVKPHRTTAPLIAHAAKAGVAPKKFMREIRVKELAPEVKPGLTYSVEAFDGVIYVDVIGTSKGKGFAGVMKRHLFAGLPASHGTERKHRSPGTISANATNRGWGGDIKRGMRMAGHMGDERCTNRNLKLIKVDKENNLLLIKGTVPGANGGFVYVRVSKTARLNRGAAPAPKAGKGAKAKAK